MVDTLIKKSELPEIMKKQLLKDLRGLDTKDRKKCSVKRPAICLRDIECAENIYFFIQQFILSPQKNQIYGEIVL